MAPDYTEINQISRASVTDMIWDENSPLYSIKSDPAAKGADVFSGRKRMKVLKVVKNDSSAVKSAACCGVRSFLAARLIDQINI